MATEYIEVTTKIGCAGGCLTYCPQEVTVRNYGNRKLIMSFKDFKQYISTIPKHIPISFGGVSEPFGNPDCIDMMEYAAEQGHSLFLFSCLLGASTEDVDRLIRLPVKICWLHLPDGVNLKIPFNCDYWRNVANVLEAFRNTGIKIMNDTFKSHNRENVVRGVLPKPLSTVVCERLQVPQFFLMPDGSVYLCCMDFGLKVKVGDLSKESYTKITQRFLQGKRKFPICYSCSDNIGMMRYLTHKVVNFAREKLNWRR